MTSRRRRRMSAKRQLTRLAMELGVLMILLGLVFAYRNTLGLITFDGILSKMDASINLDIDEDSSILMSEYTNIALFGLDNRSSGEYSSGRSDTIMIASIHNKTGEVRLVSVYRDTYLNTSEGRYGKANGGFAQGGAQGAVAMLNSNLDLDITQYVCVDWKAVVEAIDALGGLDLEITEEEMKQINKYKGEVDEMTGLQTADVTQYGMIHLDGTQATTYARIRKTAGNDFLRTSRQRIVLQEMLKKAKTAKKKDLLKACVSVFDDIRTTLSLQQIAAIAARLGDYEIVSTTGFPFELTTKVVNGADCVVPIGLTQNVSELHAFLFQEDDYEPSDTVKKISKKVASKTGITSSNGSIDTSLYNQTAGNSGTSETIDKNRNGADDPIEEEPKEKP